MSTEKALDRFQGKRRSRLVAWEDVVAILKALDHAPDDVFCINLYGIVGGGFVPNSYKYRAPMTRAEFVKKDGVWSLNFAEVDGKRSHGEGREVTINNRRASSLEEIAAWIPAEAISTEIPRTDLDI
jgi:hypothetical protein